jgi:PAS domain S-box-containing protein
MPKLESEEKAADGTNSARREHGSDDDRRHLEKLVADRTRELADANAELQLRIQELRQGERAWRESEERYRELADLLPLVVLETDEKGTLTFLNRKGLDLSGYNREEIGKGLYAFELIAPEDRERAKEAFLEMLGGAESVGTEYAALRKDGTTLPILLYSSVIDRGGRPAGLRAVVVDVTEQKQAEQAWRGSEERLRNVFDSSLDQVYRLDLRTGAYDYVSPASKQVMGYTPEEYMALGLQQATDLVHPDDQGILAESIVRLLTPSAEPFARTVEYRVKHKDLGYRWVSDHRSVVYDDQGTQVAVVGSLRDITDRKEAEEGLRRSEEYYRSLIEKASDVTLIVDSDMTVRYASPSVERTFGYEPEELVGQSAMSFVDPDDVEQAMGQFAQLLQSGGVFEQQEFRVRHADGTWRIAEAVASNLLNHPVVEGIVVNFHDVTERKHAEEKVQYLYEQEKDLRHQVEAEMKRRVEFARALAHELKTPLTSVLASSDLLAAELRDEPLQGLARGIRQGALNLNGRIDDLLDLARGEVGMLELKLEATDISKLLRVIADGMAPLASKRDQSLELALPLSLPPVRADATRVQQIVTNLLNNALKFTPVGGTHKLSSRRRGSAVVVEVRDTGRGIRKDQQDLLFEPYRRLQNGPSAGLGLGLALCKTLVELHGGRIWVKSTAGKGATFGFSLPLEPANRQPKGAHSNPKQWKVLMIEDDEEIVKFVSVAFRMRWPEAELISTAFGEQGVRMTATENPDLVILDLGLPDIDGFEVLEQIRQISPIPVVIVSVRGEGADRKRGFELGANDYVVKPFKLAHLLECLRTQLGERAASSP